LNRAVNKYLLPALSLSKPRRLEKHYKIADSEIQLKLYFLLIAVLQPLQLAQNVAARLVSNLVGRAMSRLFYKILVGYLLMNMQKKFPALTYKAGNGFALSTEHS